MGRDITLEMIEWVDPASEDPWTDVKDLDLNQQTIVSIGQVVAENKTCIAITLNYNVAQDDASCTMIIPKRTILRRKKLPEPKWGVVRGPKR